MPRAAIEALAAEMRKLSERLDQTRHPGGDAAVLSAVERGLLEVHDALRALAPAENLVGVGHALRELSQRIDLIVNAPDRPALEQLEGAIVAMRGIVSHAASNDALASLSDEVRSLARKLDEVAGAGVLATLEVRIATLADALEARNRGEDRIAKLAERLDASDSRLDRHLGPIERGLAELRIHLEQLRVPSQSQAEASVAAAVDSLAREIAELRETERRTRDALAQVHGTLGRVVDRLVIETEIRGMPAPAADVPTPPSAPCARLDLPLSGGVLRWCSL